MNLYASIAALGALVIGVVDTLLVVRVLRAWRRTRKRPHLLIALGVVASYAAAVGACLVLAAEGSPALHVGAAWWLARGLSFVGAGLAYGLVGLFAADAFGTTRAARLVAAATLGALVVLGAVGVATHETSVATPATTAWWFRVPFVALALGGSLFGALRARKLATAYTAARRAGRAVDGVGLGRMRTMALGFLTMAVGQVPLLGFAPGGRFDDPAGLACVAVIMLGALGFVLACVATWATPAWLRRRWAAGSGAP